MNFFDGDMGEFGQPKLHVSAAGVVIAGLGEDVEIAVFAWVAADACYIVPVAPVGAGVIVDEEAFEVFGAHLPVHFQVFYQKRGHILAAAVAHKAGGIEFAHVGVDEWDARFTFRPAFKQLRVVFQVALGFVLRTGFQENFVAKFFTDQAEIIAPKQFKKQPIGAIVGSAFAFVAFYFMVNEFGR